MKSVLKRFNHITEILKEISDLYNEKLGDNLLSIYIRESVSVSKAKPDIFDINSITVTKKSFPERNFFELSRHQIIWKKYPKADFLITRNSFRV